MKIKLNSYNISIVIGSCLAALFLYVNNQRYFPGIENLWNYTKVYFDVHAGHPKTADYCFSNIKQIGKKTIASHSNSKTMDLNNEKEYGRILEPINLNENPPRVIGNSAFYTLKSRLLNEKLRGSFFRVNITSSEKVNIVSKIRSSAKRKATTQNLNGFVYYNNPFPRNGFDGDIVIRNEKFGFIVNSMENQPRMLQVRSIHAGVGSWPKLGDTIEMIFNDNITKNSWEKAPYLAIIFESKKNLNEHSSHLNYGKCGKVKNYLELVVEVKFSKISKVDLKSIKVDIVFENHLVTKVSQLSFDYLTASGVDSFEKGESVLEKLRNTIESPLHNL